MNRIDDEHQRRNTDSRPRWECFASHRRRVTDLLLAAGADSLGRLCALGAGNCNDLELQELTDAFAEVHLVDLDESAVLAGVRSQGLAEDPRIRIHGGIDLSGFNALAGGWTPEQIPAEEEVQQCLETVSSHASPDLSAPYDVVVSVCLLSQLIDSVAISLGGDHPRFLEVVTNIRLRHLRMLMELTEPAGTATLITDFVSSGTYPALATTSDEDLPGLATSLINARNFFTGINPAVLHNLFRADPEIAPQVNHLEFSRPWLWDFGPRTYAVYAITVGKT